MDFDLRIGTEGEKQFKLLGAKVNATGAFSAPIAPTTGRLQGIVLLYRKDRVDNEA